MLLVISFHCSGVSLFYLFVNWRQNWQGWGGVDWEWWRIKHIQVQIAYMYLSLQSSNMFLSILRILRIEGLYSLNQNLSTITSWCLKGKKKNHFNVCFLKDINYPIENHIWWIKSRDSAFLKLYLGFKKDQGRLFGQIHWGLYRIWNETNAKFFKMQTQLWNLSEFPDCPPDVF